MIPFWAFRILALGSGSGVTAMILPLGSLSAVLHSTSSLDFPSSVGVNTKVVVSLPVNGQMNELLWHASEGSPGATTSPLITSTMRITAPSDAFVTVASVAAVLPPPRPLPLAITTSPRTPGLSGLGPSPPVMTGSTSSAAISSMSRLSAPACPDQTPAATSTARMVIR